MNNLTYVSDGEKTSRCSTLPLRTSTTTIPFFSKGTPLPLDLTIFSSTSSVQLPDLQTCKKCKH